MSRYFVYSFYFVMLFVLVLLTACRPLESTSMEITIPDEHVGVAIFAGGCFWCTESDFDKVPGVVATISGYIGGTVDNPTYEQVVTGKTGHIEAVRVYFDKTKTSYAALLAAYWLTIDPLAQDRQFCDIGSPYRAAIFYLDEEQQQLAQRSKDALDDSGQFAQPVTTMLQAATTFYPAEDYHQDYYLKNPARYERYRNNCGRDKRLLELWGRQH